MSTICKENDKKVIERAKKKKGKKLVCYKCGAYSNKEKRLCKPKKNAG